MERRETDCGATLLGTVAAALDTLDDEELRGVIARAQGLLLNRPDLVAGCPRLAVEIVETGEADLLAAYRVLAPAAQRRVRATVSHLTHQARTAPSAPHVPDLGGLALAADVTSRRPDTRGSTGDSAGPLALINVRNAAIREPARGSGPAGEAGARPSVDPSLCDVMTTDTAP